MFRSTQASLPQPDDEQRSLPCPWIRMLGVSGRTPVGKTVRIHGTQEERRTFEKMAALRKNKSLLAKLTDEDVRAWQELRRPRPPFPYGEGVSITLRIGAPRFPVDRVLIHLE